MYCAVKEVHEPAYFKQRLKLSVLKTMFRGYFLKFFTKTIGEGEKKKHFLKLIFLLQNVPNSTQAI